MLAVAGLLVALRVGACPDRSCPVDYTKRFGGTHDAPDIDLWTQCCDPVRGMYDCYAGTDVCMVSTSTHRCCYLNTVTSTAGDGVVCDSRTEANCQALDATQTAVEWCNTTSVIWCPPPPPPATDEGLNEAETGVIVVVSLIAVAAVAGAVAVCRANT